MLYGFRIFKEDSFKSKVFEFYHHNSSIIIILLSNYLVRKQKITNFAVSSLITFLTS